MTTDASTSDSVPDGGTEAHPRIIGVLMGGLSAEREVSLATGDGVLAALRERGHECIAIDWTRGSSLPELLVANRIEVVWNALHGPYGEDGAVQGLLACMGIACTGSGILASALAIDKLASKRIFTSSDLPTPGWTIVAATADPDEALKDWPTPMVVKPACEGSSVGVSIVRQRREIAEAVNRARGFHGATLVEKYIAGAELHIGILGDEVLGTIEVRPKVDFYDYQAKYKRDDTEYLLPTVDRDALARSEEVALAAYRALGCTGYGRVDLRVELATGQPYLLEVNTLPGMTPQSLLPKIAAHAGIGYPALCERILDSATVIT